MHDFILHFLIKGLDMFFTKLPGYRYGFARFFKTQDPDTAGKRQVQTNIKIFL